jgi:hypothetical protein
LIGALLLAGCGTFNIDADDVKGFTPSSQIWLVESNEDANRHSFVLTSISGYCSKQRLAKQDEIDALARHDARIEGGDTYCESWDKVLDDLADAYGPLEGDGAAFLYVTIAREDETAVDAQTVPEAGEYRQVGAPVDGRFTASYERFGGKLSRKRAEAYTCLESGDVDEGNWQEFQAEEEPDLRDSWSLDSGILTVGAQDDDAWTVEVEGDLLDGSSSIGSLDASWVAERCGVPMQASTD